MPLSRPTFIFKRGNYTRTTQGRHYTRTALHKDNTTQGQVLHKYNTTQSIQLGYNTYNGMQIILLRSTFSNSKLIGQNAIAIEPCTLIRTKCLPPEYEQIPPVEFLACTCT